MAPNNEAAWSREAKAPLVVGEALYNDPSSDEIVVKVKSIALQPLDASIQAYGYLPLPYPFILGSSVAGTVFAVGSSVTRFKTGDRVVCDTGAYYYKETKYGGWQKYVVSQAAFSCKIELKTSFEDAVALPFSLLTAVGALSLTLGMPKPGRGGKGKVLIWGASGSVGGSAVQYASSAGYDVIATASVSKFQYVKSLGATDVYDYNDSAIVDQLKALGPFDFVLSASGDAPGVNKIGQVLSSKGGKFAIVRPKNAEIKLPNNVEAVYDTFAIMLYKQANAEEAKWWYDEFLPAAINGKFASTPVDKIGGGLHGLQQACDILRNGVSSKKLVICL